MSLSNTEKHVKDIRRKTRRKFSSEEKLSLDWRSNRQKSIS
jgi:hypothetical protein